LPSTYAEEGGVDYQKLQAFKDIMVAVGRQTHDFPNRKGVFLIDAPHSHGAIIEYRGPEPHREVFTIEGLGNKNWLAEWMYLHDPDGGSRYGNIAQDLMMMGINDNIAQGADPFLMSDEIAAGTSDWFTDTRRSQEFAEGVLRVCRDEGIALGSGETPAYKYLIKSAEPVVAAPTMTVHITGLVQPSSRLITGENLRAGDQIVGVFSNGVHSNGISLLINRGLQLPDKFLTKMPNGQTFGEAILTPTPSYSAFVRYLLAVGVEVHALLPGTGDGVAKLAYDKRPFTYYVHSWPRITEVPHLFAYINEILGVSTEEMLKIFNCGIGYYVFVPKGEVERTIKVAELAGHKAMLVGLVREGERLTIWSHGGKDLKLPPPGD